MKKLTCIIVDDQSFCISLLSNHVMRFEDLILLHSFIDPCSAMDYLLNQEGTDILFTDVEMDDISGITLAEAVEDKVKHIVFVTSHSKYELQPNLRKQWHYLSKPTSFINFQELFRYLQSKNEY